MMKNRTPFGVRFFLKIALAERESRQASAYLSSFCRLGIALRIFRNVPSRNRPDAAASQLQRGEKYCKIKKVSEA